MDPGGRFVACLSWDGLLRFWSLPHFALLAYRDTERRGLQELAADHERGRFATSAEGRIHCWAGPPGACP